MANGTLGRFADLSAYRQAASQPRINPLDALIQGFNQGQILQQLPEVRAQEALARQLNMELQRQKLRDLQNPNEAVLREVQKALALQTPDITSGVISSPIGLESEVISQPGALTPEQQILLQESQIVSDVTGSPVQSPVISAVGAPITPITLAGTPTGFSRDLSAAISGTEALSRAKGTTSLERQLLANAQAEANRISRENIAREANVTRENIARTPKPTTVSRFSDSNGFLFNQSSTGGPATPVLDQEGNVINIGVANQVISTDQGIFTLPKKSDGGGAAPTTSGGLQPLTGPGGTPLTKTTGKGGATSEAGRALATETARRSIETIDELLPRVDASTVGLSSLTKVIPGSPALNFSADLDQLKSNIRIGALQEMRNASKTGGAFGNVSNQEGKVLESTLGSLDQKQSVVNMKKNLNKIKESLNRYEESKKKYLASSSGADPVRATTREQYDALEPGTRYIDSQGNVGTKQ